MSQVTHPPIQFSAQLRAHRLVALAALLALLAAGAVALILAIGNDASTTSVADRPAPSAATAAARPDESAVAAAIVPSTRQPGVDLRSQAQTSSLAGTVSSAVANPARPDESTVAAAIGSASTPESPNGPGARTD